MVPSTGEGVNAQSEVLGSRYTRALGSVPNGTQHTFSLDTGANRIQDQYFTHSESPKTSSSIL